MFGFKAIIRLKNNFILYFNAERVKRFLGGIYLSLGPGSAPMPSFLLFNKDYGY